VLTVMLVCCQLSLLMVGSLFIVTEPAAFRTSNHIQVSEAIEIGYSLPQI
jgi:hypothetical protein